MVPGGTRLPNPSLNFALQERNTHDSTSSFPSGHHPVPAGILGYSHGNIQPERRDSLAHRIHVNDGIDALRTPFYAALGAGAEPAVVQAFVAYVMSTFFQRYGSSHARNTHVNYQLQEEESKLELLAWGVGGDSPAARVQGCVGEETHSDPFTQVRRAVEMTDQMCQGQNGPGGTGERHGAQTALLASSAPTDQHPGLFFLLLDLC